MLCSLHTDGDTVPPATVVLTSPDWEPAIWFPACMLCATEIKNDPEGPGDGLEVCPLAVRMDRPPTPAERAP